MIKRNIKFLLSGAALACAIGAGVAPNASAAYRFCDSCLIAPSTRVGSGLTFRIVSIYAHNLGGGSRLLGVTTSAGGLVTGVNEVSGSYSSPSYLEGFCVNLSSYNVRANCHLTAIGA